MAAAENKILRITARLIKHIARNPPLADGKHQMMISNRQYV
jgi:hypothetical protein